MSDNGDLARYRSSIDNLDAALIHLLAERFKLTQEVGAYKAAHNMPAADPAREKEQIARLRLPQAPGLPKGFTPPRGMGGGLPGLGGPSVPRGLPGLPTKEKKK